MPEGTVMKYHNNEALIEKFHGCLVPEVNGCILVESKSLTSEYLGPGIDLVSDSKPLKHMRSVTSSLTTLSSRNATKDFTGSRKNQRIINVRLIYLLRSRKHRQSRKEQNEIVPTEASKMKFLPVERMPPLRLLLIKVELLLTKKNSSLSFLNLTSCTQLIVLSVAG